LTARANHFFAYLVDMSRSLRFVRLSLYFVRRINRRCSKQGGMANLARFKIGRFEGKTKGKKNRSEITN
jgi:hypothetical protein